MIQIDIKMPKSCGECRFKMHGDSCTYCTAQKGDKYGHRNIHVIDNKDFYIKREDSCPLMEVNADENTNSV